MVRTDNETGAVVRVEIGSLDEDELRVECLRLQACLDAVRRCGDLKCSLCSACLSAIYPEPTRQATPDIPATDPIRKWTRFTNRRPAPHPRPFRKVI